MRRSRLLAILLIVAMLLSIVPVIAYAEDTVTVTLHYHREDGNYAAADSAINVWNWDDELASAGTASYDTFGWTRTFTVGGVNAGEYIKFEIDCDSVFGVYNDVRYLDPKGGSSVKVWVMDGDAKLYGEPVKVAQEYTTARDGVRYVAVQALPLLFNDTKNPTNYYTVTYAASTGYYSPGLTPGSTAAKGQVNGAKVTLLRAAGITANGAQDDWWEICVDSKQMLVNFASASVQTNAANDAYSHAKDADGIEFALRHSDTSPTFQDIDLIQEGNVDATGKTFLSLTTIKNMTLTLTGWVDSEDTYLLPNMFVGYEKVIDVTGDSDALAALGFSEEKLNWYKEFMETESASADGMPFAASVTKDGKRVFSEAAGTQAQFSTTDNGDGTYDAATPIPEDEQIPVTTDTLFDLASNTKVWSTNLAFEHIISNGDFDQYLIDNGVVAGKRKGLDTLLVDMPGWENFTDDYTDCTTGSWSGALYNKTGKDTITLRMIFQHRAGLLPDPEYQNMNTAGSDLFYHMSAEEKLDNYNREELIDKLCKTPLNSNGIPASDANGAYSDQDYIVLGIIVEQVAGMPLDQFVEDIYQNELGINNTVYNPLEKGVDEDEIAATCEVNGNSRDGRVHYGFLADGTPVAQRTYTLKGEVHDEKAYYALGGVAGHAGLFSTVNDLSELMQVAINNGSYNGYQMFTRDVHDEFLTRTGNTNVGWVGLGWWMTGTSSANSRLGYGPSMKAYGHQGWTSTMTVVDPIKGITVASLTSYKHSPTVNGTNTFSNSDVRMGGNNGFAGPGGEVLQNVFAFGSLDLVDHSQREWTVAFDTAGAGNVDGQTVLDGNFVTEPFPITNDDKVFEGWYIDAGFTTEWDFAADRVMSNITLYAKWEAGTVVPSATWTVVYDHGGSVGIPSESVDDGDTVTALPTPYKAGYEFDGWYTDPGNWSEEFDISTTIEEDTLVTAKWLPNYIITYDTNGGSIVRHIYVAEGKNATDYWRGGAPYSPAKTSAVGSSTTLEFQGWYTDKELTQEWIPTTPVTSDMTVYAKWGDKTHSVKFDIRGGSSTVPAVQSVADGGKATTPATNPTKANSTFEGWYTNVGLQTEFDFNTVIHENRVLYAKFTTYLGSSVSVPITAPKAGETPQTVVNGTGYTGTITWIDVGTGDEVGAAFEGGKTYRADVTLTSIAFPVQTPMSFYKWQAAAPTVTVSGATEVADSVVAGGDVTGNTLAFNATFPETMTDKTALEKLIIEANTKVESQYTVRSWAAFKEALQAAEEAEANPDATQTEIDAAVSALSDAMNALARTSSGNIVSDPGSGITITSGSNGNVSISNSSPSKGGTVTVTITPDDGYELDSLTITDSNGNNLTYTDNGNGTFTFVYNSGTVTVTATFKSTGSSSPVFSDVKTTDWFYESVIFVVENGLFNGTSDTTFSPNSSMTRAMFATVLARLDGADLSGYTTSRFSDVASGQWYTAAIEWAADNSIVSGVGGGEFSPNASITREQMAVMLDRYIQYKNYSLPQTSSASVFADDEQISSWAKDAVYSIQKAGVITGKPGNLFDPQGTATRVEVATVFARFVTALND